MIEERLPEKEIAVLKSYEGPMINPNDVSSMHSVSIIKDGNNISRNAPLRFVNVFERKKYGGVRMCNRCLRTKPDRCHHCS